MHSAPAAATSCRDHPELPATRACLQCRSPLCGQCGSVPLTHRSVAGEVICSRCEDLAPPHLWNRFSAGREDRPGDHLWDALVAPRTALLRAGFGTIPAGTSLLVTWCGLIGWGCLLATLLHGPGEPAFARAGWGVGLSFPCAIPLVLFTLACNAFQPPGPGTPSNFIEVAQLCTTAFTPAALLAAACGVFALALGAVGGGTTALTAALSVAMLGIVAGTASMGWGLALRRGCSLLAGIVWAGSCLVVAAGMCGLALYLRAHPPWGSAWIL